MTLSQTFYHAELHPLIGGAWDCKYANVKTLVDKNPNITRCACASAPAAWLAWEPLCNAN